MNTAIAQHLNVTESAIIRVEEWANVIFAVVRGLGARFVSKKVVKMEAKVYGVYGQTKIETESGGMALYQKDDSISLDRYEVTYRMWHCGGCGIIGYAYNQSQLDILLEKAEKESKFQKEQAFASGEAFATVPSGYTVNNLGRLEIIEDMDFNSDLY